MAFIDDVVGATASAIFTSMVFSLPVASMALGDLYQRAPESTAVEIPVPQWVTLDLFTPAEEEGSDDEDIDGVAEVADAATEEVVSSPSTQEAPVESTPPDPVENHEADVLAVTEAPAPEPEPEVAVDAEPELVEEPPVEDADPAEVVAKTSSKKKRKRKSRDCGGAHDDIDKVSEDHWEIERSLVRYYTSTIPRFNSLGWSRAHNSDGERGWYISGFGCKSPLFKSGLRSRDVVKSVNGKPTNTMLQVFGAYTRMGTTNEFEVKVLRQGEVVTLHYTLT